MDVEECLGAESVNLANKRVHESVGCIRMSTKITPDLESENALTYTATGFRVGNQYIMTAYRVFRSKINQAVRTIADNLEKSYSKNVLKELMKRLEISMEEEEMKPFQEKMRNILWQFLERNGTKLSLLLKRLEGLIDTDVIEANLDEYWTKYCIVNFLKHGKFSVSWRVAFGEKDSNIIIVKLLKTYDGQVLPEPLLLDADYLHNKHTSVVRYIHDEHVPQILMDHTTKIYVDDGDLQKDVDKAVQWWHAKFPDQGKTYFQKLYAECYYHNKPGHAILQTSKSFTYGASGSPVVYLEKDKDPIVEILFHRVHPQFYSVLDSDEAEYRRYKKVNVDLKCIFEEGTTMQKVADLLEEYKMDILKKNIFKLPSSMKSKVKEKELSRSQIEEYLEDISSSKDGKARNIRIMLVGNQGTGKTCLCKNLQKENIPSDLPSTDGIDIYIQRFVVNMKTKELSKQPERSELETALNRIRDTLNLMKPRQDSEDREANIPEHLTSKSSENDESSKDRGPDHTPAMENEPTQEEKTEDKADTIPSDIDSREETETEDKDCSSLKYKEKRNDLLNPGSQLSDEFLKEHFSDLHRAYIAHEDGKDPCDKCYASFWDFGGETDYYNTHHIFLTSDAVYLLVFDLSTCLNSDKWIEQVIFWLQSIATYSKDNATDTSSGTPPIIIVGTHLDKLEEKFVKEEDVNKEIKRIQNRLLDKKVAQTIIGKHGIGMYCISNLRPQDDVFTKIWNGILSSADKQSQWEKRLPGWWLERERVLMKKKSKGVKVQTFKEIQDIDRTLPSSIDNITDVKMFLRYMHLTGSIIVSNNENPENAYIIIDPQWLVHAFSRLITPPEIQDPRSRGRDGLLWEIYEKTAELKMELVNLAWGKGKNKSQNRDESDNFLDYKDILLKVMEIFSLIAPLKNENDEHFSQKSEQRTQEENKKFIVPCKLPVATPDLLQTVMEQATVVKTSTLCFTFKNNFIPFSVYDKVIASCIQRFEPFVNVSSEKEKFVQRGCVCLRLTQVWNMVICCKNAVMKVTLFKFSSSEEDEPEPGVGHRIRKILEDLLQRVWSITHEDKLQYTIEFHNDYRVREREIRIAASDLRDGNGQRCAGAQSGEEYLKKKHYDVWFSNSVEKMEDEEFATQGISKDILNQRVTEKALSDLSGCIGNTFYLLFTDLGLSMPEIDQVLLDRKFPNFRTMILKLLHMWYCGKGEEATYRMLYQAMLKHGIKIKQTLPDVSVSDDLLIDYTTGQTQPTEQQVVLIAKCINSNFYMFFIDLGLQFDTIEKIQVDYSHLNSENMHLKMLEKWLHIRGQEATIEMALRAMKKHFMKYSDFLVALEK